jgi:repressor LexA
MDMSDEDIARRLKVPIQQLKEYLNGTVVIDIENASMLADIFNISMDELLKRDSVDSRILKKRTISGNIIFDIVNSKEKNSKKGLTKAQQKTFNAIKAYIENNGYSPTIRELCEITGHSSTSSIHGLLVRIEEKGYIVRKACSPRAIAEI